MHPDEIFGGYPWFRNEQILNLPTFPWANNNSYRASFLKPEILHEINAEEFIQSRYFETINETSLLSDLTDSQRRMKEVTNLNLKWFGQTLLERKDRMSTYAGLQARVPFCDYRIVEYLYSVPWEMKNYQGREKGLLRHAVIGLLPDDVLWRKKSPYPKTHNPEYLNIVSKELKQVIDNPQSPLLKFAQKKALENLLQNENRVPWYGQLMTVPQTIAYFLQVNYWLQKHNL